MAGELPEYYFRVRENGAAVFRVDTENRNRRIEMDQIAVVNLRKGEVRAHGDCQLSADDHAAIAQWMEERQRLLAARETDDILRAVDHLNLTAHWVQARATDAQLDLVTDDLLLAMHDLRGALVRRRAERVTRAAKE